MLLEFLFCSSPHSSPSNIESFSLTPPSVIPCQSPVVDLFMPVHLEILYLPASINMCNAITLKTAALDKIDQPFVVNSTPTPAAKVRMASV